MVWYRTSRVKTLLRFSQEHGKRSWRLSFLRRAPDQGARDTNPSIPSEPPPPVAERDSKDANTHHKGGQSPASPIWDSRTTSQSETYTPDAVSHAESGHRQGVKQPAVTESYPPVYASASAVPVTGDKRRAASAATGKTTRCATS